MRRNYEYVEPKPVKVIDGVCYFISYGPDNKPRVNRAGLTARYKDEVLINGGIVGFTNECCSYAETNVDINAHDIHKRYVKWCDEHRIKPYCYKTFSKMFMEYAYDHKHIEGILLCRKRIKYRCPENGAIRYRTDVHYRNLLLK